MNNPNNPQYRVALQVLASILKSETKTALHKFIADIIEEQGSVTEVITLDDIEYTVIFVEEKRVLCTLRAIPVSMKNECVLPIESRVAIINRNEEAKKLEVDDIEVKTIEDRISFLFSKLVENVEYLISPSGLTRYQVSMIEDNEPDARPDETATQRVVLRSKNADFYSINTNFSNTYYVRTNTELRRLVGRGIFVTITGNLTPMLITNFVATIRTRNGEIKMNLPFAYMTEEERARIAVDYSFREQVIEKYIDENFVRAVINCITADMLGFLQEKYKLFWSALKQDMGPQRKIHATGIKNKFIDILDDNEVQVFSFLPYYNTTALECEVRIERGVSLNIAAIDPTTVKTELPATSKLLAELA